MSDYVVAMAIADTDMWKDKAELIKKNTADKMRDEVATPWFRDRTLEFHQK